MMVDLPLSLGTKETLQCHLLADRIAARLGHNKEAVLLTLAMTICRRRMNRIDFNDEVKESVPNPSKGFFSLFGRYNTCHPDGNQSFTSLRFESYSSQDILFADDVKRQLQWLEDYIEAWDKDPTVVFRIVGYRVLRTTAEDFQYYRYRRGGQLTKKRQVIRKAIQRTLEGKQL